MARVLCIDDYELYVSMVKQLLERQGGHDVKAAIVPFRLSDIAEFKPDVIILNLVRKMESIGAGGMIDFYAEVEGAKAFKTLAENLNTINVPIIVTAMAVKELEVPQTLPYVAFVNVPQQMDYLLKAIDEAAGGSPDDLIPK
jgi:CheY-like chemotaxis protein